MDLKKAIREIENFPKEGINFNNINARWRNFQVHNRCIYK